MCSQATVYSKSSCVLGTKIVWEIQGLENDASEASFLRVQNESPDFGGGKVLSFVDTDT